MSTPPPNLGGAGLPDIDQGPRILAATTITTIVALVIVLARFYVRIWVVRNVGYDVCILPCFSAVELDGELTDAGLGLYHGLDHGFGTFCSTSRARTELRINSIFQPQSLAGWAIIVPEVKYGAGRHMVYVMDTLKTAMHLNFATQAIYLWVIGLVKISIGLMLIRFAPRKGYKLFIQIVIGKALLASARLSGLLTCSGDCSSHGTVHDYLLLCKCDRRCCGMN